MPLPCSPVSRSTTASETRSLPEISSGEDIDSDHLESHESITPRAGPSDPAERTAENLSRPSVPEILSGIERDSSDKSKSADIASPATSYPARTVGETSDRRQSVTFSEHLLRKASRRSVQAASAMSRTSPILSSHAKSTGNEQHGADSSADENTAFFRRDAAASRAYGGVAGDSGQASQPDDQQGRKSSKSKSKSMAQDNTASTADAEDEGKSWWSRTVDKYGSIELENKGSVARDHLALERTFLAWLRTSLSFASIGIAITQLFRLNTTLTTPGDGDTSSNSTISDPAANLKQVGKPLGATFLAISILILLLGFHRYFESQHYVIRGKFPASRGTIFLVSLVAGSLIVASLAVVLAVAPGAFET